VIEFDWEAVDSRSLDTALNWCRRSLVDREADDAARLWDAILAIAGRTATAGGDLEWTPLVDELAPRFQLIYRLDVAADWEVLQDLTDRSLDFASDHLGRLHLERATKAGELADASSEHRFVAVLGRSGAGKTGQLIVSLDYFGSVWPPLGSGTRNREGIHLEQDGGR
jgi:hypothetical protein